MDVLARGKLFSKKLDLELAQGDKIINKKCENDRRMLIIWNMLN